MKKTLLLWAVVLPAVLLAWCSYSCPSWSEYRESTYENWKLESQWCFAIDSDVMEWHWIYYFENGWKDMEWDIVNDQSQWKWTFYDENGNNIVVMEWTYKDDVENGEWKYYDDEWNYICSDIFENWILTDKWSCEISEDDEIESAE
jgi:hypothetical protein